MSAAPTVSVMIPCFNAEHSLRWAVASMLEQSFTDWECLIIDDGSTDGTWELLQRFNDPRIRLQRLRVNRGRGWARAAALEMATGQFLGMVDADDWVYPDKLSTQVAALQRFADAGLVSSAMAITDGSGNLIGRQGPTHDELRAPLTRLGHADLPHASSLLRMEAAREAGYDRSLRFSEDHDLLVKVRRRQAACVVASPSYVYSQPASMSFAKMSASYDAQRRIFAKQLTHEPLRVLGLTAGAIAKREVYRLVYAAGLGDRLVARRWSAASTAEVGSFEHARAVVGARATFLESALANR
jgi:glycosyltransferase involved in cell wall biosynthesis